MTPAHALRGLRGVLRREFVRTTRQRSRLASALVRPLLWLVIFGAGLHGFVGPAAGEPYAGAVAYREYMVPGLVGIILLFNGMLSSLSMVYDREMGMMRILLTAPLPRWYLLGCRLMASALFSLIVVYVFLGVAWLFDARIPAWGWLTLLPAALLSGLMLGALGLLLSVHVRQMENFAGAMNFVIFPAFFASSALFPLTRFREAGADWLYWAAQCNPFTHAVELMRFAAYGRLETVSLAVVAGAGLAAYLAAVAGYDPGRGLLRAGGRGGRRGGA